MCTESVVYVVAIEYSNAREALALRLVHGTPGLHQYPLSLTVTSRRAGGSL